MGAVDKAGKFGVCARPCGVRGLPRGLQKQINNDEASSKIVVNAEMVKERPVQIRQLCAY